MLVLGDWLITSATDPPHPGWGVRVVDGVIDDMGAHDELRARHPDDSVHPAAGHIVLPGFVNTHTHLYGTLAHGIPMTTAPSGFWSFLEDFWWPKVEDGLDHAMIRAATDWVCAEMLTSGTTSFYDILEAPQALPEALLVEREVVAERGLRGVLSFEATERLSEANGQMGLTENVNLLEVCRADELVSGMICYHTTFTCSSAFIRQAFALADEYDVGCHAHCNEGQHEGRWCEENHGMRTIEYYDDLGVAGPGFLASQCVQLSERERALIAETGIRVSHMPLSNCEVGGGIAPVPEMLDSGVIMGLGSDGYINDFYEVMRGAFLLHKARLLDPATMAAERVLHLATEGGATALGFDRVGRLEPGWAADLQVVDATFPTPVTADNLYDQLVLWRNHSHVRDVMVAGTWRVVDHEVQNADRDAMRASVQEQADRLWAGV